MPAYPEDSGSGSEYEEEEPVPRGVKKRVRGARNAASKRARQDTLENEATVSGNASLFDVVRQGKMAMTSVVDDWIEAYKSDRSEALLDLIQFFINASGCKGTITPKMLRDATEGFQNIIKKMTEEFDEDSGDYPLIASGTYFRKFRSNFCDFVQSLVRQCQYQIIYDQFMMDNILTLLTELSNSQVRAFRHTSTLAAMKLMTGLVNVALQLSVSLDNTQRQYDAERNKSLNKRASEKLDILLQKRKELEEQQGEIEGMLNGIFKGIFVHRYRDYIADIRALCMEEIGIWMRMFPKVFLTDSYLKYVGWTLHDKQKEVRNKCLNTLIGLYSDNDMAKDLKLFTSRFKDRIVSMTLDKEYDVAVLAIKLLILVLSNCGYETPVLTSGDCESVYQLVFSCHRPVAVAAAEFLNKQLFQHKDVNPGYTKRGRRRSPNAPLITDLVLFFIESELHEHATYLVDSLWDVAGSMLKDWECMSDMLLEEPANDRDALDERQESALVDIMVCSVKQAADGAPPSGRQGYSKKVASRDRKVAIEDKVRLTEHFIVALPNLLKKYHVDREKVAGLLQIPRFFDLEFYTTSRLEKHLDDLLQQMAVVVDKHTDSEVLEQASRTYRLLCDNEYAIYDKVSVARRAVTDGWFENFRLALDIFKEAGDEADDEEIYNVVQSMKRLTFLYMFNDLSSWNLYGQVNSILQMYKERNDSIPEPMLRQAIKFIYYDLIYGLKRVKQLSEGIGSGVGEQDPRAAISQLRQHVTEYLSTNELLLVQSPHKKVQEASYMSICDVLIDFAPQLASSSPTLKPLVQRAGEALQHALIDFVRDFVFTIPQDDDDEDDTAKIDALHRRRSLLAAICKLFVFNMINLKLASCVFQQYIRYYSDYGDIIKETISRSRHVNKLACAQTLALSLMVLFRDTVREQGGELDHSSQQYGHMKELARRFALTFGLDQVKTRDAVAELHKEGILFALKRDDAYIQDEHSPPPNLSFLGILVEFSAKLMRQDKKTVVQYLDKHIKDTMLLNQGARWIPLVTYRNSLVHGADDDAKSVQAKGRRGRRRKNVDGDFEAPATPRSPMVQQPPTPMTPQPMTPQQMGPPQLTSTVARAMQQGVTAGMGEPSIEYNQQPSRMGGRRKSWSNRAALYDTRSSLKQIAPFNKKVVKKPRTPRKQQKANRTKERALAEHNSERKNKNVKSLTNKNNVNRVRSSAADADIEQVSSDLSAIAVSNDVNSPSVSCRGRVRVVPSYVEKDPESGDDFEDVPPTWGVGSVHIEKQDSSKKIKSKEKTKKKHRGLFEESDDEMQISDYDDDKRSATPEHRSVSSPSLQCSFSEKSNTEAMERKRSLTPQRTFSKSPRNKVPDHDILDDDFFPLPKSPEQDQQSNTESLAFSNPFQNIVSKVRREVVRPIVNQRPSKEIDFISEDWSDESSANEFDSLPNSVTDERRSRKARQGSYRKASASEEELEEDFFDAEEDENEEGVGEILSSEEEFSDVKSPSHLSTSLAAPDVLSQLSDNNESEIEENFVKKDQNKVSLQDFGSDDSDFGAFKNVVHNAMLNTTKLSQSQDDFETESESSVASFL